MNESITIKSGMNYDEVVEELKRLPTDHLPNGHKFVLKNKREMIISVSGIKKPKHADLGDDEKVITAGYFKFEADKDKVKQVYFDNQSKDYWPPLESLKEVGKFISDLLKLDQDQIELNRNKDWPATDIVTKESSFYEASPQKDRRPDGKLSKDEKVRSEENDPNYPKVKGWRVVRRRGGQLVYVATESLKGQ